MVLSFWPDGVTVKDCLPLIEAASCASIYCSGAERPRRRAPTVHHGIKLAGIREPAAARQIRLCSNLSRRMSHYFRKDMIMTEATPPQRHTHVHQSFCSVLIAGINKDTKHREICRFSLSLLPHGVAVFELFESLSRRIQ